MKQIKPMLLAFSILITAGSCSKDAGNLTPEPPTGSNARLSKVEYSTNDVETYTYNAEGRLVNYNDNIFVSEYSYSVGTMNIRLFENDNTPFVDMVNITLAGDKITSFGMSMYNNGIPNPDPELNSFVYDADGYQVRKSYGNHLYDYTIANGNIVNMKQTNSNNGQVYNTSVEYYTDKANNLNLNLFENWYFDQCTVDREMFGKTCKNLPKKVTDSYGVKELSYVMTASGLPEQVIVKFTKLNGEVQTSTIKLSYE